MEPRNSAPDSACADYTVMGARGSGQSFADSSPPGFGTTGAAIAQAIAAELPGTSRFVGVGYPALSVAAGLRDPAAAVASVRAGITATAAAAVDAVVACPETRLIGVGFSQGAMVMHGFAATLTGRSEVRSQLVGLVLLGDPSRDLADPSVELRGIAGNDGTLAAEALAVPPALKGRVLSYCLAGDEVCDPPAGAAWSDIQITLVHQIGYRTAAVVADVAKWVAAHTS